MPSKCYRAVPFTEVVIIEATRLPHDMSIWRKEFILVILYATTPQRVFQDDEAFSPSGVTAKVDMTPHQLDTLFVASYIVSI